MRYLMMASVFMVNAACVSKIISAAIPQKGQKAEELKKVKSVAIVAFDVLEFRPTGAAGKLGSVLGGSIGSRVGSTVATAQTGANLAEEKSELGRDLYDELSRALTKKGWNVMPLQKVTNNSMYRRMYATKKGTLLEKAPNQFHKPVVVEGVMRPVNPVYMLKPEERTALAKSLGVDAIIFARVSYYTRSRDMVGLGVAPIYLHPTLAFNMYGAGSEEPIWFDYGYEGPESADSIGKVSGMEDATKIAQLTRPLATETFQNFLR